MPDKSNRYHSRFLTRMIFLNFFLTGFLVAQPTVELQQAFLDLSNDGVVMNISAHPDDEDGATLAYYRMKHGVKTYSVFFTRGEGGQNEIGSELYEELGVIRTEETMQAAAIQGTEVHFLNLLDFGFSKTATETFAKWGGKNEVVRRLVFMIRKLKPDVIFTHHNTVDGHGHHQAVGIAAIAAFDAAADSSFFPEQLKEPDVSLWQVRKLYFRNFGRVDQTADVAHNVGEVNQSRNMSYHDIAAEALRMHKSQGMDRADLRRFTRGLSLYKLTRANNVYARDTTTFFSGIDLWSDPSLSVVLHLKERLASFRFGIPHDSLLDFASGFLQEADSFLSEIQTPLARRILQQRREEVETIVRKTCGVVGVLEFTDPVVVPRQEVDLSFIISSSHCRIGGLKYRFDLPRGWSVTETIGVAPELSERSYSGQFTAVIGEAPMFTLPKVDAQYNPIEARQGIVVHVSFMLDGRPMTMSVISQFDVAPPQVLDVQPKVIHLSPSPDGQGKKFQFAVRNHFPHKMAGQVTVETPPGWRVGSSSFVIPAEDSIARGSVILYPPGGLEGGEYKLRFTTEYAAEEVIAKAFDVAVAPGVEVGIVKSYDTTLENAVAELGLNFKLLDQRDLSQRDLMRFETILVDIRAYLVRSDLKENNARLLEYVRNGGHLVVMYQKDQEWKPEYAPFPFQLTRRRVSVEEAPVKMLHPDHPLLSQPNRIEDKDWDGWIQERGVYFPANLSTEYVELLASHDPDEQPLTTGYIVATAGNGSYVYTSYVWYRQLKEYHHGAFRCFANMVSYPAFRKVTN